MQTKFDTYYQALKSRYTLPEHETLVTARVGDKFMNINQSTYKAYRVALSIIKSNSAKVEQQTKEL